MPVSQAIIEDIPALVALINGAYRGEASKKGWTTEADLLKGELRTDIPALTALMNKPQTIILKYTTAAGDITGSVYLEKQERGLYLGMLSVTPLLQDAGIGKHLMSAAEQYAQKTNCPCIFMSVISIRFELIAWYERRGYRKTGETKSMPADNLFGIPTQPLEFAIMEKKMEQQK